MSLNSICPSEDFMEFLDPSFCAHLVQKAIRSMTAWRHGATQLVPAQLLIFPKLCPTKYFMTFSDQHKYAVKVHYIYFYFKVIKRKVGTLYAVHIYNIHKVVFKLKIGAASLLIISILAVLALCLQKTDSPETSEEGAGGKDFQKEAASFDACSHVLF